MSETGCIKTCSQLKSLCCFPNFRAVEEYSFMLELNRYILALSVKLCMYSPLLCISPPLLPHMLWTSPESIGDAKILYLFFHLHIRRYPSVLVLLWGNWSCHRFHQFSVPVYHFGAMFSHHLEADVITRHLSLHIPQQNDGPSDCISWWILAFGRNLPLPSSLHHLWGCSNGWC